MATGNAKAKASADDALLIKRYASRRLYNTENLGYVDARRYRGLHPRRARGEDRPILNPVTT